LADLTPIDLRRWREARSLTQAQAARALGVSPATWQSWELDRRHPDRFKLAAIGRLTEADVARAKGGG
jgi:transcriptional regulator with XRE-family HTH domain